MKKYSALIIVIAILATLLGTWKSAEASTLPAMRELPTTANKIGSSVSAQLNAMPQGDMLTVIVTLRKQADLSRVNGANRAARQQGVIRALQATSNATQGKLNALLNSHKAQGLVNNFEAFWVFNGFSVTATQDVIDELAQDPDVYSISSDELQIVPAFAPAEANVTLVNAPALWSMGYSGQGVVVANMDSGVDGSHPDLSNRWRGGSNSWFDPYGQHPFTPTDLTGHGTWTMGTMVGGDTGGTTIGVAPSATWIAVKIFNDSNSTTTTAIHQGFQWLLDPDHNPNTPDAPNVVNNSWTYSNPGCFLDFEPDLQSLRAAGILPVFAAGNGGSSSNTSFSPSNNPSAFAVGAINNNSAIYSLSSRGPSICGGSTGPFPEIVAPGVNVRTTDLYGGYTSATGTSLAAPHVAGGLALILSAYPNLSAVDQQLALINSAVDLGISGPDDTYGYGRLDLLAAFNWLVVNPTSTPAPINTPTLIPTLTPIPTATFTSTPAPVTLHIGDLDRSSAPSGTKWNATVTILVHNNLEQAVTNATVTGKWSNGASGTITCTTNASGICTVTKTGLSRSTSSVTFTITNITKSSLVYNAASNHDPDGESNGTTIVILKP